MFDWVRSLPPDHPLSQLCTAPVYATMLHLHGQWRQPGKALRLLSDAKARGLELGSDIYSALVLALCKWVAGLVWFGFGFGWVGLGGRPGLVWVWVGWSCSSRCLRQSVD